MGRHSVVVGLDNVAATVAFTEEQEAAADASEEAAAADLAVNGYKDRRLAEYPSFADRFDLIYHSGIDAWKAKIKETKDKYAKPE